MSRTSVAATWYPCDASNPQWVPIGRPIRNVRTYVLDEELNPVPVGDTGQMYLAGAGLARGYLGHPGRTAASFLPDPFAERPGERMCATGDNVRLQPDGNYVYVGRIDDQIKISGYRVEIGEVEHNLRACQAWSTRRHCCARTPRAARPSSPIWSANGDPTSCSQADWVVGYPRR